MNHTNILIVMLVATLAVLGLLCVGSWQANTAYAKASNRGVRGNYIMVTGSVSENNELLYLVDVPHKKVLVYGVDGYQDDIRVVDDSVRLDTVFQNR
jgi:hypothetical protein